MLGDYSDIDMEGIPRQMYDNVVPRHWQEALKPFPEGLRFIWNPKMGRPCIVVRAPSMVQVYHHGTVLRGWMIVKHCTEPWFDPTHQAHMLGNSIRTHHYRDAKEAEKAIDAHIEKSKADWQKGEDDNLEAFVESEYPVGLLQERALDRDAERETAKVLDMTSPHIQRRKRRGKVKA